MKERIEQPAKTITSNDNSNNNGKYDGRKKNKQTNREFASAHHMHTLIHKDLINEQRQQA